MGDLIHTALKKLLPRGSLWQVKGQMAQVIEALSLSLERSKLFLVGVQREALPAVSEDMIDEWLELLGVSVPAGTTLHDKQKLAGSAYTAIGGQSFDYVTSKVQEVFANVYIEELSSVESGTAGVGEVGAATTESSGDFALYYYVRGFYPFAADYARVLAILTRIAPLQLVPVWAARSVYDGDVARCAIASTGRAICGRRATAYKETDAQIGRTAVGRTGAAITGRVPA